MGALRQSTATKPKVQAAPISIKDYIASKLGAYQNPVNVEMIDGARMSDVTAMLDDALARKAGHAMFNPKGTRVKDLELHYFIGKHDYYGTNTQTQCLIRHKTTGKEIISNCTLWPRNDFWAILVDIMQLA